MLFPLQDLNSAARATRLVTRFLLEFLEGQCLFSQDTIQDPRWTEPGACGNVLQQSNIRVKKPARNWFHEIFLQAIAGDNCSTMTLVSPGLQVRLCLCLQFSTGSNCIPNEFEIFARWRFLQTCKRTRTFAFFLRRHGIDTPPYAFISIIYKSRTLEAEPSKQNRHDQF